MAKFTPINLVEPQLVKIEKPIKQDNQGDGLKVLEAAIALGVAAATGGASVAGEFIIGDKVFLDFVKDTAGKKFFVEALGKKMPATLIQNKGQNYVMLGKGEALMQLGGNVSHIALNAGQSSELFKLNAGQNSNMSLLNAGQTSNMLQLNAGQSSDLLFLNEGKNLPQFEKDYLNPNKSAYFTAFLVEQPDANILRLNMGQSDMERITYKTNLDYLQEIAEYERLEQGYQEWWENENFDTDIYDDEDYVSDDFEDKGYELVNKPDPNNITFEELQDIKEMFSVLSDAGL